jgi:hypothetical protein
MKWIGCNDFSELNRGVAAIQAESTVLVSLLFKYKQQSHPRNINWGASLEQRSSPTGLRFLNRPDSSRSNLNDSDAIAVIDPSTMWQQKKSGKMAEMHLTYAMMLYWPWLCLWRENNVTFH